MKQNMGIKALFYIILSSSMWLLHASASWHDLDEKPSFRGYESSTVANTAKPTRSAPTVVATTRTVQQEHNATQEEANRPLSMKASDIYYLGSSDVLEIDFFNVPELQRTVRINERGFIKLPLVGALHVGGMTGDQLEAKLTSLYAKDYLQSPQITVFIKDYAGQYTMEGLVRRVGVFKLRGQTTVMQAIAQAGGLSDVADSNDITLFRRSPDGAMSEHMFNYEKIKDGEAEDFLLEPNDVVIVNLSLAKAFGRRLLGAVSLGTLSPTGYVGTR